MYLHSAERVTGENKRCNKQESFSMELYKGKIFDLHKRIVEIVWHSSKSDSSASVKYLLFVDIKRIVILPNISL